MYYRLIGAISPLLRSISNYIDKTLLTKLSRQDAAWRQTLFLFSSGVGIVMMVICLFFTRDMFAVPLLDIAILIGGGLIYELSLVAYFKAMEMDDASYIVPLFQFIPILSVFADIFFFHETLTIRQIVGTCVVVTWALLLGSKWRSLRNLRRQPFALMLSSCLLIVLMYASFKHVNLNYDYRAVTFWQQVGFFAFSGYLLFHTKRRTDFVRVVKANGLLFFSANALNEIINIAAIMIANYITLYLYISQVNLINALQPIFILILGFLLTKRYPNLISEDITRSSIIQKIISIVLMIGGVWLAM